MRYPPERRDETRSKIVGSAKRLFNKHGFESVSIDDIMAAAELTRGGFYRHFDSKSELFIEALDCFFTSPECGKGWEGEVGPRIVGAYLSQQHRQNLESSCPMSALAGDVARTGPEVKKAYENALNAMIAHLQRDAGESGRPDRKTALAIAALCIGGVVVARASQDLAEEMCAAAKEAALALGGWNDSDARAEGPGA